MSACLAPTLQLVAKSQSAAHLLSLLQQTAGLLPISLCFARCWHCGAAWRLMQALQTQGIKCPMIAMDMNNGLQQPVPSLLLTLLCHPNGPVFDQAQVLMYRNRHFRTAFSSKGGKSYTLQPTGRYATASGEGNFHGLQLITLCGLPCSRWLAAL